MEDTLWYKDAIFYEVPVRSFYDSSNDGSGDFAGLTTKLSYIRDLGVDCIWLLPFYPSPLRDDGYDIADFYDIHPDYGTLDDFKAFLDRAHELGMRVIADMVLNHTSDQHPWFQEARRDPDSPYRDYYVWSDDPKLYKDARIIFTDTEISNWTFDPVAGQYYWHRFFSNQPDLNYREPRRPTSDARCDRLLARYRPRWFPLRRRALSLRAGRHDLREPAGDARLSEVVSAALWTSTTPAKSCSRRRTNGPPMSIAYFGNGDEFHMAFHFPIMPRIFMAIRREERMPIVEIMEQTPDIPELCQWGMFLRNHDELTLEMVTDAERDYMYYEYAKDPRMKINIGIRRRLAPLAENGRRQIELLNSILLSMPGSPILYYGDEIGMGDNYYLGDRNGVRTPMQWSSDRNAGFSRTDPARLYSPVIMDPVYGYQSINVEAQERTPTSLLNWIKRLIRVRKKYPAFGRGSLEFLGGGNPRVLTYIRQYEGQTLLIVLNLSRFVQCAEVDLVRFVGMQPVELIGETHFPAITEHPYFFTLGPHAFYWFRLESGS